MRKFELSLDDFSPREGTSDIEWCFRLIDAYPDIKIDLFVPAAYARLNDKCPFFISKHPEWIKTVQSLPENFRICLHGMYHRRKAKGKTKYHNSNNDEWEHFTYKEAECRFEEMIKEFDNSRLEYKKVFRPPGWRISEGAVKLLVGHGFKIAGNKEHYNKYKSKIKDLAKHWVSYNWDMVKECDISSGDILSYGHTSDWTNNYMNEERYNLIRKVLDKDKFEFKFIEELL